MTPFKYIAGLVLGLGLVACEAPKAPQSARHTPRWAFSPWISKDISTGADTRDFVKGFKDRDIPVGVVVLDSPWETNYNTFIPNENRYPDLPGMMRELKAQNIRVVNWVTQMVNTTSFDAEVGGDNYGMLPSPNYLEGKRNGYYVNDGKQYVWWKGQGAGLDFFNPAAVAWWHAQQDALLDAGLAGWKLDFGEDYVTDDPVKTAAGDKSHQEYSELYYHDYLTYGVSKRGREEFVTMVRPYDKSYDFPGRFYAKPEDAPVCWVGDNRRDWVGLQDALDHMFISARAGYVMLGSDIGGYLDRDDTNLTGPIIPFSVENFQRWIAVGALTPFMQLHGRANLTPWTVPERVDETIATYRYWAKLHEALLPFWYSLTEQAYSGGPNVMRPIGEPAQWPNDYRYELGDAFLVAPILNDSGKRDVPLPSGVRWFDWWNLSAAPIAGGTTVSASTPGVGRVPLFVREGALVPMLVKDDANKLGAADSEGKLTVLAWPTDTQSKFVVHDDDDRLTTLTAQKKGSEISITASRAQKGLIVRVQLDAAPKTVQVGSTLAITDEATFRAAKSGAWFDASAHGLWVKAAPTAASVELKITP